MNALVIAGTHSGVGKTTITLALLAACRQRGLIVQPFKVGPDFIDPGHHTAVSGRTSRNLDTWMLGEDVVRRTFVRAVAGADLAIIEGVMGLFDGRRGDDPRGSTADLARLLDVPVILVVDAAAMAASIAAVVKGFRDFDLAVRVAGVICNRVAGPRHYEYLETALRRHTDVVPLGWLPRDPARTIPERHLGLTTAEDLGDPRRGEALCQKLSETVDIERLLELGRVVRTDTVYAGSRPRLATKRVAVARDAAFCFYYPENLELLAEAGAEVVAFSPLHDVALPDRLDLLYLGGGYPELHAERLAGNSTMLESIRHYHRQGGRIYAECGGLMFCCRELVDLQGKAWPMLNLLPARAVMQARRAALGYVTLRTSRDSLLGPAGTLARGHEFHYSRLEALGDLDYAATLDDGRGERPDGLVAGNLWAGYAHLHFGSNPALASSLLQQPVAP